VKIFLCELERDGRVLRMVVRENTIEEAIARLSISWIIISIKEYTLPL
jgi:hypothetical protein